MLNAEFSDRDGKAISPSGRKHTGSSTSSGDLDICPNFDPMEDLRAFHLGTDFKRSPCH